MKNTAYHILIALLLGIGFLSCSLEPEYYQGKDSDEAITDPIDAQAALTGAYSRLGDYAFGGRDVIALGDVATDLIFDLNRTTHMLTIWRYNITVTDPYLQEMWEYGYKVVDNTSRLIDACNKLYPTANESDKASFDEIMAQAYGLRALAQLYLVNIFALPYKVNGTVDNGLTPGIVATGKVINPGEKVSRNTVAGTYGQINADIEQALQHYSNIGGSSVDQYYMNEAAVYALKARVALYEEDYQTAIESAQTAISLRGGHIVTTSASDYRDMFTHITINSEDIFTISKSLTDNLSANSIGTLYSSYGLSPAQDAIVKYFYPADYDGETTPDIQDIRYPLLVEGGNETTGYEGGKYYGIPENRAVCNIPVLRLPEQYLIIAEANVRWSGGSLSDAQTALLEVARRNPAIQSVADLPSTNEELFEFIKAERARELWMEGHRFADLRRWGEIVTMRSFQPFDIAKFCYPIPSSEINSAAGVTQTENWEAALPVGQ